MTHQDRSPGPTTGTFDRLRGNSFLIVGRAGMDVYADPPGCRLEEATRFTAALGGSGANIAAGIAKLGGAASLLTVLSDDAVGRFVLGELHRYGVDTAHIRTVGGEARTSLAVVESRLEDCQSVIYRNGAADFALTADDLEPVGMEGIAALIVTGTALALEPSRTATLLAMSRARVAGAAVILDIDYRPYSWASPAEAARVCGEAADLCDILVGNDAEFAVLAGGADGRDLAQQFADRCAAVVYKMGPEGSVSFAAGKSFATPAFKVAALKPTGAGDAFMAGLVTGLAEKLDLESAVVRGSAAAAITVTRVGCAPASPTAAELAEFIRRPPLPD